MWLDMQCENCGSKNLKEENGAIICLTCGSKFRSKNLEHLTLEEELREKEIRRLVETKANDPNTGLLTDEEILKYAPDSSAADDIRYKNATTLKEKINAKKDVRDAVGIFTVLVIIPIIICICFDLWLIWKWKTKYK